MPVPKAHVGRLGRRSATDPVIRACREWYAGVVAAPPTTSALVKASWDARFHPVAWPLTRRPTRQERRAEPGRFFFLPSRDGRGRFTGAGWWAVAPQDPQTASQIEETASAWQSSEPQRLPEGSFSLQSFAGGVYVVKADGRVVLDADEAAALLATGDPIDAQLSGMVRAMMPASRGQSPANPAWRSRKRLEVPTAARALALALLVPSLGTRAAARELFRWDQQLDTPDRNRRAGELASRPENEPLRDTEPDNLDADEAALLRSARRVWRALGVFVGPVSS